MKKRLFALLLAVLALCAACPPSVFADGNTITLRTAEDWAAFAQSCVLDSFSRGKTVVLEADLDLSGTDFSPVPLFAGRFLGNGHTISGYVLESAASVTGLFRQVLAGGVIENLNAEGSVTPGGTAETVGGLVGINRGALRNCAFTGTVRGSRGVGGLAGVNAESGVIENCVSNGTVAGEHRVGGVSGENNGLVTGSTNRAAVNTDAPPDTSSETAGLRLTLGAGNVDLSTEELADLADIGGVAGFSAGRLSGCVNEGTVGYPSAGYNVGGIAGRLSGVAENCVNAGEVRGRKDVGGVVGQLDPDARWSFAASKLERLRSMLRELQGRVDTLLEDTEASSDSIDAGAHDVLDAMARANDAAEALANEGEDWIDENLAVLNELSRRVEYTIDALGPITEDLSASADEASKAARDLGDAAAYLQDAIPAANEGLRRLEEYLRSIETAVTNYQLPADPPEPFTGFENDDERSEKLAAWEKYIGKAVRPLLGDTYLVTQAVAQFEAAGGDMSSSLSEAQSMSRALEASLQKLKPAIDKTTALLDALSAMEALRLTPPGEDRETQEALFDALGDVNDSLGVLADRVTDQTALYDLHAVSDQLFSVTDYLVGMLEDLESENEDYVEDVSADETARAYATVAGCVNRGAVSADTNAGGVAGAVTLDLSFDREDSLNISSLISGGAKYLIFAVVRDCKNAASVTAKKESAGGIAGRMDYGAAFDCESAGAVSASGGCAGGVSGLCLGSLYRCRARANIEAPDYAGGIAGRGHTIASCLAMPDIAPGAEFSGAIAGDADGTVEGNWFSGSAFGGINGFSFAGQAEETGYEDLLARSGGAEIFRTITVTFVAEGETVAAVAVPFGGSVETLPAVPDKDGRFWKWDEFDNGAIYHSLTVGGAYHSPVTTIATAEDPPLALAEGSFYEGERLTLTPLELPELPELADMDVLAAYRIEAERYEGNLTVRLRAPAGGTLYVLGDDNTLTPPDCERDGSYLVFALQNGGSVVYAAARRTELPWAAIGAGGGALVLAGVAALLLRKRAKQKSAPGPGADAETKTETEAKP